MTDQIEPSRQAPVNIKDVHGVEPCLATDSPAPVVFFGYPANMFEQFVYRVAGKSVDAVADEHVDVLVTQSNGEGACEHGLH